jgi:hypothetical protein
MQYLNLQPTYRQRLYVSKRITTGFLRFLRNSLDRRYFYYLLGLSDEAKATVLSEADKEVFVLYLSVRRIQNEHQE